MAWRQGGQGGGKPNLINNLIVDKITSLTAAQAISAALYARKDGRGGQHVKLSLMAAAAIFSWLDQSSTESFLDPDVKIAPSPADFSRLYQFSDGWATILPNSDAAFLRMCRAFGVTEVEDPALQTFLQRRNDLEGGARVTASLEAKLAQVPISEGMARLAAIDVPCAPVMTLTEMATHPHSAANELFADNQYPLFGRVREARPAAQFSGTPARIGGPAPTLGQDTDSLLAELGMDAAALRAAKAVR
jgi:crotonobetainyl-CoA:carnitine CoA-transferase CaiB-like acyl-CoA transferase